MWQCPKCGRTFQTREQDHFCGAAPKTIDEYIADKPEEIRPLLHQVRDAVRTVLPDAQERISWSMPTFWQKRNIIHFAAFRHHIGLYPGPEAIGVFADRLTAYKTSKGAVQLPFDRPLPLALIAEIAQWCLEKNRG